MLLRLLVALALVAAGQAARGERIGQIRAATLPRDWAECRIGFATPEAAKEGVKKIRFAPLKDNRSFAFSTRWDDTHPGGAKVAETLRRHDMPGTFYHVNVDTGLVAKILGPKQEIGCHTCTHRSLGGSSGNTSFCETMASRCDLECAAQRPVLSFVLPGCVSWDDFWTASGKRILGDVLRRVGFTSSPEFGGDALRVQYGFGTNEYFMSALFAPGDRKNDPTKFREGLREALEKMKAGKLREPIVTQGVHPWLDAEGFQNLDRNMSAMSRRRDVMWPCTQTEYAAYRRQMLDARIQKVRWNDRTTARVTFDVYGRGVLGADVPLTLILPETATTYEGRLVTNRVVNLYPRGRVRVPTAIDQVRNAGNASRALQPAKRLPLAANLRIDLWGNLAELAVRNDGAQSVELANTLRLPPHWKAGAVRFGGGELKPGETRTWEMPLGACSDLAELRGGKIMAVVQVDVSGEDGYGRLWVRTDLVLPKVWPDRGDLPIQYCGTGTTDVQTVNVPVGGAYRLWCWHSVRGFDRVVLNGEDVVFRPRQTNAPVTLKAGANTIELFYPEGKGGKTPYSFAVTAPKGDPRTEFLGSRLLWCEDFDSTPCGGRLPAVLASAANAVTTNELCRWVQNVDARSVPNALAYDFSQLDAGTRGSPAKPHGWMSWTAAPNTNGWTVCRLSLKGQAGGFCGEIRGHFLHRDDPATKRPQWWIAYWINVDETFRIRPHLNKTWFSLGKLVFNAWNDVELWLPTEGNRSPVAYGRVNDGPWVEMDLGGMVMKGSYDLMQIGGSGSSKWLFDDFSITREL